MVVRRKFMRSGLQRELLKELYLKGELQDSDLCKFYVHSWHAKRVLKYLSSLGMIKFLIGFDEASYIPIHTKESLRVVIATQDKELMEAWNMSPKLKILDLVIPLRKDKSLFAVTEVE